MSTELGTKQSGVKRIQVCSIEGPRIFPWKENTLTKFTKRPTDLNSLFK